MTEPHHPDDLAALAASGQERSELIAAEDERLREAVERFIAALRGGQADRTREELEQMAANWASLNEQRLQLLASGVDGVAKSFALLVAASQDASTDQLVAVLKDQAAKLDAAAASARAALAVIVALDEIDRHLADG